MRALAIRLGVPADQILIDPKGARTFDTCLQAKRHYNIASALIVSQKFHLPRALAICEVMGISAVGVRANIQSYHPRSRLIWELREIPATLVALWDAFKTRRINAEEVCSTHPKRTFE
jgi:vancomycin permeability regulator SanA